MVELSGWTERQLVHLLFTSGYKTQLIGGKATDLDTFSMLVLVPQADEDQTLSAYAAGVDQFIVGRVPSRETVARVRALLRRSSGLESLTA
jgi:DNA-binding response OmpR family regulator